MIRHAQRNKSRVYITEYFRMENVYAYRK